MKIPLAMDRCCPVCGEANECRIANGCLYKGACWCEANEVPAQVLRYLAGLQPEPACLCRRCLVAVTREAALQDEPEKIIARVRAEATAVRVMTNEDYYLNAKGQTVFTAAYHRKRGYCCENGCLHCPYQARVIKLPLKLPPAALSRHR